MRAGFKQSEIEPNWFKEELNSTWQNFQLTGRFLEEPSLKTPTEIIQFGWVV